MSDRLPTFDELADRYPRPAIVLGSDPHPMDRTVRRKVQAALAAARERLDLAEAYLRTAGDDAGAEVVDIRDRLDRLFIMRPDLGGAGDQAESEVQG